MKPAIFKSVLLFVSITGILACGNSSTENQEETAGHQHEAMPADTAVTTTIASLKDAKLNGLYAAYLDLKSALVKGDSAAASAAAKAIESAGRELNNTELQQTATKLVSVTALKEQRVLFGDLSALLIAMVKQSGLSSGKIYVEYCPMAFDNKGASWLSNEEAIRNPYFGDEMLTCGEVTETIQ